MRPARVAAGLAASLAVLTVLPLRARPAPQAVLPAAPLVGLLLGGVAAGVVLAGHWLYPGGAGAALAAVLAVGTLALLTRGLHLDGLADTADGLGRFGGAQRSLAVMRAGDVGPFGVVSLLGVLAVDVAALARDTAAGRGAACVAVAVLAGRLAMTQAGLPGIPAARPDGLGAAVAGTVRPAVAATASALALAATLAPAAAGAPLFAARLAGALTAGCLAGWVLRRRAARRLGGITGDVLGAVCEVATCAALAVSALR